MGNPIDASRGARPNVNTTSMELRRNEAAVERPMPDKGAAAQSTKVCMLGVQNPASRSLMTEASAVVDRGPSKGSSRPGLADPYP